MILINATVTVLVQIIQATKIFVGNPLKIIFWTFIAIAMFNDETGFRIKSTLAFTTLLGSIQDLKVVFTIIIIAVYNVLVGIIIFNRGYVYFLMTEDLLFIKETLVMFFPLQIHLHLFPCVFGQCAVCKMIIIKNSFWMKPHVTSLTQHI